ncbi:MAG: hypothetical protein L6R28_15755 [Planctomycetes bacterium]|nr:hypothetical protein [Planctomycetota bacterium]
MSNEQTAQEPDPAPEPPAAPAPSELHLKHEPAAPPAPRKADAAKIEQAFAKDPAAAADAAGGPSPVFNPITRGDCTLLGAKLFGGATAVVVLLAALMVTGRFYVEMFLLGASAALQPSLAQVTMALYFTVLPMALLGAYFGFEIYRVLACSRRPLRLPGPVWFVLLLLSLPYGIAFWLVLPLYLQFRLRERVLHGVEGSTGFASFVHLVYLLVWVVALFVGVGLLSGGLVAGRRLEHLVPGLAICAWSIVWLGDYALVMAIASWRSTRILAPAKVHTVQFTLGALMTFIFVVGTWVAGLVKIFE